MATIWVTEHQGTTAGNVDLGVNGKIVIRNIKPQDAQLAARQAFYPEDTVASKTLFVPSVKVGSIAKGTPAGTITIVKGKR